MALTHTHTAGGSKCRYVLLLQSNIAHTLAEPDCPWLVVSGAAAEGVCLWPSFSQSNTTKSSLPKVLGGATLDCTWPQNRAVPLLSWEQAVAFLRYTCRWHCLSVFIVASLPAAVLAGGLWQGRWDGVAQG